MSGLPLLLVAIAAAPPTPPPPAASAARLAAAKSWDDLYVTFASVDAAGYSAPQRSQIARALSRGCVELEPSDAVMAFTLGDRAAAFADDAEGLLCLARSAEKTQQLSVAEAALRKGAQTFPARGVFALTLAKKLVGSDPGEAAQLLATVPKSAREYREAQKLLVEARRQAEEQRKLLREAQELEARLNGASGKKQGSSRASVSTAVGSTSSSSTGSLTYESTVQAGMRVRANSRFKFKYFNNDRDFGQRAEYEGRVAAALDEAYETSNEILGEARVAPVDVVLYTSEEFATHFGGHNARYVAGLYDYEAMRLNNAAELSRQTKATLVHEYIHAVEHDVAGDRMHALPKWFVEGLAEYVEWRYLGRDEAESGLAAQMKAFSKTGRLPSLEAMTHTAPASTGYGHVAYAASATAVRLLVKQAGTGQVMQLMRDVRDGASFDDALMKRFGRSVGKLQEDLSRELSQR